MTKQSGEQGDFLGEAQLALDDIADGIVAEKQLSKCLNNPEDMSTAYINIRSSSNKEFCIELSQNGYRIIGNRFDDKSQLSTTTTYYESLQALLTNESKSYVDRFAENLQQKLLATKKQLEENDETSDNERK